MVNVEGADVGIIPGYPDTIILTTEALYHFSFDTNILVYKIYQY